MRKLLLSLTLLLIALLTPPSSHAQFIVVGQGCGASGLSAIANDGTPVVCKGSPLVWTAVGGGSGGGNPSSANQVDPTQAPYNVKADAKSGSDGGTTSGQPTFTSTNQSCIAADVGKLAIVVNSSTGVYPFGTGLITVLSCNGNAWTLSGNASATLSNTYWGIGSENGTALASARAAAIAAGQTLALPCGTMIVANTPFPAPANMDFVGQTEEVIGCTASRHGSRFILHPAITGFAAGTVTFKTGSYTDTAGLQTVYKISNLFITSLSGNLPNTFSVLANMNFASDISMFGVCFNSPGSIYINGGGELNISGVDLQGCQTGGGATAVSFAGQQVNSISNSIIAYQLGPAVTCNATQCNISDSYITTSDIGVQAFNGATLKITGSQINATGGNGSNGALYDAGAAGSTIWAFGNVISTSQANFPAINLTVNNSVLDISGTNVTSTTAGCNVATASGATINDRAGNKWSSAFNGTGNCVFSGKYVPIGGGSVTNNTASAATNFGANLGATNVLTGVTPGTATYDVKIGFRQVTAGTTCGAGSNTVTGVLSWTSGGVTFTTGANGIPALGTLTISANGSVGATGSTNAYVSQPVHIDAGTQITFTTTSTLASAGCTIVPQYVVDFSTI